MTDPLAFAARHGRVVLILGLVIGIAFPPAARAMRPWIGELVILILFISALRVGPRRALGAVRDLPAALGLTLVLQVAAPVAAILVFGLVGWTGALATGLVLMLAAPPIAGSPNLAILTGADPAPALRQLVVGTALLGLTVIPVLALAPGLGDARDVFAASARLAAIIALAAGAGFLARSRFPAELSRRATRRIDGASAIVMSVMVIALMSAVGPAIRSDPAALAAALAAAFLGNFGLQALVATALRGRVRAGLIPPLGIVAGNRNIALFLAALPAAVTDPLLLFIGCYQIPMYLTPLLLGRLYGAAGKRSDSLN